MNKNTLKITQGAAMIAIFTLMVLLNRQTAGLFQEVLLFAFPVPLMVYSAQYGWKSSLPVLAGMACFAFIFGTFTALFYAVSEALIGLVLGSRIFKKADMTKTLFITMLLSAVIMVMNTIVLAGLFGMDLNQEVAEMQLMMNQIFEKAGVQLPGSMISADYLKQTLIISMAFAGILQGFVIFQLCLILLRRLHYQVERPKSVFMYFPPKWIGYVSLIALLAYYVSMIRPQQDEVFQNLIQVTGICGNLYLMCFGWIGILFYVRVVMGKGRLAGLVIGLVLFFMIPIAVPVIGFVYTSTKYHRVLLDMCTGTRPYGEQEDKGE